MAWLHLINSHQTVQSSLRDVNTTATHSVTVRTTQKPATDKRANLLESLKENPTLEDQAVNGNATLKWINTAKGEGLLYPAWDGVVISCTHFPHCYRNTNDKCVYPGMPPDSMWLANVTSYDHTSNCHLRRPSTPHRTEPEWIPMRMSRSTCKMNTVTNIKEWQLTTNFITSRVPKCVQAHFAALTQRARGSRKELRRSFRK